MKPNNPLGTNPYPEGSAAAMLFESAAACDREAETFEHDVEELKVKLNDAQVALDGERATAACYRAAARQLMPAVAVAA